MSQNDGCPDNDPNATTSQDTNPAHLHMMIDKLDNLIVRIEAALSPVGKLTTVNQAASCLGISPRMLREQLYLGRWPGYRAGRAVRVDPAEIRKIMKRAFVP